jgi:ribosomal protein S25
VEERNKPNQTDDQETIDRIVEAIISAERPVVTTDEIADRLNDNLGTTHLHLTNLHNQGRIERMQIPNSQEVWWVSQSVDGVLESDGPDTILKRLSSELETPISLDDGTVYENGDKHSPDELDHTTKPQDDTPSMEKNTTGLVPSSEESGEKRQQLKDGADLDDVSE